MAGGEPKKTKQLRVVDEDTPPEDVYLLEEGRKQPELIQRLEHPREPEAPGRPLTDEEIELARRTREPDIGSILETDEVLNPEEEWMSAEARSSPVPHGWFVAIFLTIAGTAVAAYLLGRLHQQDEGKGLKEAAIEHHGEHSVQEREALQLLNNVESTLAAYLAATRVEDLLPLVRDPDRVEPLMRRWYERHPLEAREYERLSVFQPLDLEGRLFWVLSCRIREADGRRGRVNLLAEQDDDDQVRIDWETEVCYQPMPWDEYVRQRPQQGPLDFRVVLEHDWDGWYSHEFEDEDQWHAYRMEAKGSDEYLIGYARRGGAVEQAIDKLAEANRHRPVSVVVRLNVPPGTRAPRGVVIEELLSERWAMVKPRRDSP